MHMGGEEEKEERGLGFPGPNAPDEWGGCYMYYTRIGTYFVSRSAYRQDDAIHEGVRAGKLGLLHCFLLICSTRGLIRKPIVKGFPLMQIWTKTSTGSIAAVLIRRILARTNFPAPRGCEFTVTHIPLVQFNSPQFFSYFQNQ